LQKWSGESRLSEREVEKIKKWVVDRDREERRSNIIIKGVKIPKYLKKDWSGCKVWAAELIKEKVEVE